MTSRQQLVKSSISILAAAGVGVGVYELASRRNFSKLSEHIDNSLLWNDEWDMHARIPVERYAELAATNWFVAPDDKILKNREEFDERHGTTQRSMVMVRHGQYETDGDRVGQLTQLGRAQADETGKRLAHTLKTNHVRVIYHSTMPRARETAEIIAKYFPNVEVRETPLLAEGVPVEPDPPSSNCPPYVVEEGKRMESAFRSFFSRPVGSDSERRPQPTTNQISPTGSADPLLPHSVDLLIGHGNCFRFFLCRALQVDPRFWLRFAIYNCGVSRVELFDSGRISVRGVGDVGHLNSEMVTYS